MHKHEADDPAAVPPAPDHVLSSGAPDPVAATAPQAEPSQDEPTEPHLTFPGVAGAQTGAVIPPSDPIDD